MRLREGKWLVQGQQLKHGLSEHLNPDQLTLKSSALGCWSWAQKWEVGSQRPSEVASALAQQCCSQSPGCMDWDVQSLPLGGNTLGEECHWDAQRRHAVRSSRQQGEQGRMGISGQTVTALQSQGARPQPQAPKPVNSANPLTSIPTPLEQQKNFHCLRHCWPLSLAQCLAQRRCSIGPY